MSKPGYPDLSGAVVSQPGFAHQTTVQVMQNIANPMMPRGVPRPWSTEIMSCFDDMTICLCTTFVPCYHCMLATDMNESCCVPFCVPGSSIGMRATIRARHNIEGNLMNDCACMTFCGACTTCQLAREVQNIKNGRAAP